MKKISYLKSIAIVVAMLAAAQGLQAQEEGQINSATAAKETLDKARQSTVAPIQTSVSEVLRENGTIIIENPEFGGALFLAFSGYENFNREESNQKKRADAICKMLGFTTPTIVSVAFSNTAKVMITVDEQGNGTSNEYGPWKGHYGRDLRYFYYNPAYFSRLGCKK